MSSPPDSTSSASPNPNEAGQLKLVIKSANQKYEDFVIENGNLDWSVKHLKEYLRTNYPNKPDVTAVRLIYSGKLLNDHLSLKECIRYVML